MVKARGLRELTLSLSGLQFANGITMLCREMKVTTCLRGKTVI